MQHFDGTVNAGRKGIAYDWQSLLAAAEIAGLERQLAHAAASELAAPLAQ